MFGTEITTKEGHGRKILNFPYSSLLAEKVKTIFGHRYLHTEQRLSYPHLQGILTKILTVFGGKESSQARPYKSNPPLHSQQILSLQNVPNQARKSQSDHEKGSLFQLFPAAILKVRCIDLHYRSKNEPMKGGIF